MFLNNKQIKKQIIMNHAFIFQAHLFHSRNTIQKTKIRLWGIVSYMALNVLRSWKATNTKIRPVIGLV